MGASANADRAGGPSDLSRDASQPEALIPCAADDLILRVADAIYAEFENRPRYAQEQMNGILAIELATAAFRAMRAPCFGDLPEPIALAGETALDMLGMPGSYSAAHSVWDAMVVAALGEHRLIAHVHGPEWWLGPPPSDSDTRPKDGDAKQGPTRE